MGIYRNNVAFQGTATSNATGADAANNSWSISGLTLAASDFKSLDTAGVFGPRKPDGSLPDVDFLKPSANSKLLNKGKDVGQPFAGSAPDLGAFEYGATSGIGPGREGLAPVQAAGPVRTKRGVDVLGRKRGKEATRVFPASHPARE
jgi:hypothetical protein